MKVTIVSDNSRLAETLKTWKGEILAGFVFFITNICSKEPPILGLDCEWTPPSSKTNGTQETHVVSNRVAILQLSTGSECLLIRLPFLNELPQELNEILSDPKYYLHYECEYLFAAS